MKEAGGDYARLLSPCIKVTIRDGCSFVLFLKGRRFFKITVLREKGRYKVACATLRWCSGYKSEFYGEGSSCVPDFCLLCYRIKVYVMKEKRK